MNTTPSPGAEDRVSERWRPIGTAPRDGTQVLLGAPLSHEYSVARWDRDCWDAQSATPRSPFIVWMPLPEFPL